jgi:twitching motility protein PilT
MSQALDIRKLLKSVVAYKASDLHLVSRSEPQIRIDGRLVALNLPTLDGKMIEDMAYALLTEKQKKDFEEHNELDFAIMLSFSVKKVLYLLPVLPDQVNRLH